MMKRATFSAPLCATALLALVAVSFGEAQAQSAVITGKVTGRQGEALGGAIVVIEEFSSAVATTTQGTYTLTLAPERTKGQTVTLRARYIGYSPGVKQVTLTPGTQTQDFELKFDPMTLDAVVVTGVAEATEAKKLTFAVGHVDAQTLNQNFPDQSRHAFGHGVIPVVIPNILPLKSASAAEATGANCQLRDGPVSQG